MLKEAEIRTFIEGATNYFQISAQQSATVGSPYLVTDGNPGAYEYTGVIGISGTRKGIVYFTAPRGVLTVLLMRMQETDTSDENIKTWWAKSRTRFRATRAATAKFRHLVPTVIAHEADKVTAPHNRST
jgi:chemotaxis protein CheX